MTQKQREMTVWLNRAYHANNKINALMAERNRNIETATKITPPYNNICSTRSINNDNSSEAKTLRICEANEKIDEEIKRMVAIKEEIKKAIKLLENENSDHEAILHMHYLGYKTWEQVAEEMNYSVRAIKYKHVEAIKKLCIVLHS